MIITRELPASFTYRPGRDTSILLEAAGRALDREPFPIHRGRMRVLYGFIVAARDHRVDLPRRQDVSRLPSAVPFVCCHRPAPSPLQQRDRLRALMALANRERMCNGFTIALGCQVHLAAPTCAAVSAVISVENGTTKVHSSSVISVGHGRRDGDVLFAP